VLATVLLDSSLTTTESILLNRSRKDFDDCEIRAALGASCIVIWSFDGAAARIESDLKRSAQT
jgi:hypothetical protein